MGSYLETLNLNLPSHTDPGKNRLRVLRQVEWTPPSGTRVSYVSSNRILIVAGVEKAKAIRRQLPKNLLGYVAVPSRVSGELAMANGWKTAGLCLEGYLGRFTAYFDSRQGPRRVVSNLGTVLGLENGWFDQVIDTRQDPLIKAPIKPLGYYHVGSDAARLEEAIDRIPRSIGAFEKPQYVAYDSALCAHGRKGIKGCTRCLEVCPTEAIISIGEQVEVRTHLCQGSGACASSCPSAAIRSVYPAPEQPLELLRLLIREMRELNGGRGVAVLVFDRKRGWAELHDNLSRLPEQVIPVMVEDIGSIGLDFMSCALAYGANDLCLYVPAGTPAAVTDLIRTQRALLIDVLQALGLSEYRLSIRDHPGQLNQPPIDEVVMHNVASFAPIGNKRNVIRTALSWLNRRGREPQERLPLETGAPFGRLALEAESCTLCLGCVSVCPANALQAGYPEPALRFIEANCLQCGICVEACPESAIALQPRLCFDHDVVNRPVTLHQEAPFLCLHCARPFATQSMISKLTEKLKDHPMYDSPAALKRLQLCEQCRFVDLPD